MLMKKGLILVLNGVISMTALAQTVPDAKKYIYYERYKSAGEVLQNITKAELANGEAWYLLSKAYLMSDDAAPLQQALAQSPATVKGEPFYQVAYGQFLLS